MSKNIVKSRSAEQTAYDGIISLIMEGIIKPGSRLIAQQVADILRISRTPVGNAMRTLSSEGLLENRGTGGYMFPELSLEDLTQLFKIRFILEPEIVLQAAINAPDSESRYYESLIEQERMYYYYGNHDMYKINKEIHCGIAALSKNRYMVLTQKRLFWRSEVYVLFFDNYYYATSSLPLIRDPKQSVNHIRHEELIKNIFNHDANAAKQSMYNHLLETWKMLKNNISSTKNSYGRMLIKDWSYSLPEIPYEVK